jgi:hypothetical protein
MARACGVQGLPAAISLGSDAALSAIIGGFGSLEKGGAKVEIESPSGLPIVSSEDPATIFTFLWTLERHNCL